MVRHRCGAVAVRAGCFTRTAWRPETPGWTPRELNPSSVCRYGGCGRDGLSAGRRAGLDQLSVGADDVPQVVYALPINVTSALVGHVVVERPAAVGCLDGSLGSFGTR